MIMERNPELHTIEEIVSANSGMQVSELLEDTKIYKIDQLNSAAEMIRHGIRQRKIFYIVGDYDVDGISASAILDLALHALGAHVVVRLPKRFTEGYGFSTKALDEFEPGQFVLTVDNGITAFDAVHKAKEMGMTVIVTDHHLAAVNEKTGASLYPEADLIIDPNAILFSADFSGYCGAGLAYKLSISLLGTQHKLIPKLVSLAAIATIADSVPMLKENRRIVQEGLKTMITKAGSTMGLYALLYAFDIDRYVTTEDISFKVAPAMNAPGRLRDDGAMDSYQLLTFEGPYYQAKRLAEKLLQDNQERRTLSDYWTQKTKEVIAEGCRFGNFPIVVYVPGVPEGIIGIIAGRMAELMHAPCFVLADTEDEEIIKGSGRTFGDIHLKSLLDSTPNYLVKYGGHAAAAGISLKRESLDNFDNALIDALSDYQVPENDITYYDLKITPDKIGDTMRDILKFGPYGNGNESPVIYIEDLMLTPCGSSYYTFLSNGKGVRLRCSDLDIISFDGAFEYSQLCTPRHVSLIGTLSLHYYMGRYINQMEVSHICAYETGVERTELAVTLEKLAKERYQA